MKNYYPSNRKKIRGWKRRIKQIEAWGGRIKQPYLGNFTDAGIYTYDRCILYPFYTLEKHHPPLWFFKLIVAKFITAYGEWEKIFNKMDIASDIQLWLYDPSYIRSEIIAYKMNTKGDRIRYAWESELVKPFPHGKFGDDKATNEFEWILADEELVIFENELEFEELTAGGLLADGYIKKDAGEHGIYYAKRIGDLWIGRKGDNDLLLNELNNHNIL